MCWGLLQILLKRENSTYSEKENIKIIISNTSRIIWMGENRDTINKAMDLKSSKIY